MRSWNKVEKSYYHAPDKRFKTPQALYAKKIINDVMSEVEEDEYVHKLRVSKLPICGLLDAIERLEKPTTKRPYSMDFYTSIGTAVHESFQNRMIRSKKRGHMCYGSWRCSDKQCNNLLSPSLRPDSIVCPKCKSSILQYEELEFNFLGISGHLDMLTYHGRKKYKNGSMGPKRYIAWELKTTNEYSIQSESKFLPYSKHRIQIETYCFLLKKLYNINVVQYNIVYISRNKASDTDKNIENYLPIPFKVTPAMLAMREKELRYLHQADKKIIQLINNPTRKNLKALEDNRACFSLEDYNKKESGMKNSFFGESDCPFKQKGLCFRLHISKTEAGIKLAGLLGIR